MTTKLDTLRRELRTQSRWLHGHGFEPQYAELERVAAWCRANGVESDVYGKGEGLQAFEAKVAELLGYAAARYFPSGSMAQPIALRMWSERAGIARFGMHPTCHIELHEERGYSRLHNLQATWIGPAARPMSSADLKAIAERLAAVVIELPTRENGGQLPTWEELVELCSLARERGVHPHLDGARLWEAQAFYDRPFAEICANFDSTYVSFYKGIGAMAGAMLLGPEDFIAEAALWQRRQGGNLYSLLPNWASAAMRMDARLPRFSSYRTYALELAEMLRGVDGLRVNPDPPHVNMFHLHLDVDAERANAARDQVAQERGLWLFGGAQPGELAGTSHLELYLGEAALARELEEVRTAFVQLMELARAN